MNKQESILSYWRDIEIFTLPEVPDEASPIAQYQQLPWKKSFEESGTYNWRHTVYFGKCAKQDVVALIEKQVGPGESEDDWSDKPAGFTCMAVMIVDQNGKTNHDGGYLQASFLHGLKCLVDGHSLDSVSEKLLVSQQHFRERYPVNQMAKTLDDLSSPVLEWGHLIREIAVLNGFGIPGISCENTIYVKSDKVPKDSKPDPTFLNSFYLEDLRNLLTAQKWGKGVQTYLSEGVDDRSKKDMLANVNVFFELLDPSLLPAGRWPSNPEHGLYAAQSAVVNTCLQNLKHHHGIMGVNGPPGTGKTTLLLDIIADVVTDRAKLLLEEKAGDLFEKGRKIEKKDSYGYYFAPRSSVFEQTGIVVASNNNAAVENISKELPDEKKISREHFPEANYFTSSCSNLIKGASWGLMAAALGNGSNKAAFKKDFWFPQSPDQQGFASLLYSVYNNAEMIDHSSEYVARFEACKKELAALLEEFDTFKMEAGNFHGLLSQYLIDVKRKTELTEEIAALEAALKDIEVQKKSSMATAERLGALLVSVNRNFSAHQSIKPAFYFFHQLFNSGAFRKWKATMTTLLDESMSITTRKIESDKELSSILKNLDQRQHLLQRCRKEMDAVSMRTAHYTTQKDFLYNEYGIAYEHIPDEKHYDQFDNDKESFHKSNPWSSVKLNTLRGNIFLTSLRLHEYAILAQAKSIRNNLSLFMEMLDGKVEVSPAVTLGLWQSFFFCVPVVSTSLASVSKLFRKMPPESIGWLLLDEAGQASPQSSVGAIFRSCRSIIIGDPLQIEPVVTIPEKLAQVLNKPYKTESVWSPLRSSTQILADRNTVLGTWMTSGKDDQIWTGLPLRTHRRCNSPMFDIANTIAYGGQMVKATADVLFDSPLGASVWFDVEGNTVDNKQVVMEEVEFLVSKISQLKEIQDDIFVISPFKSVADKCREVLRGIHPKVKCGTIHTFQGKEANVVFLVLGSAPDKPSSRQWASGKPNMLNVALTRAKRRCYVIGNKKLWATYPYFEIVARAL